MTDITEVDEAGNDTPPEGSEPTPLTEVELLATEMGWRPEAEYNGPKEKWKPAKEFIKAERDINRGMKQEMRSMRDQLDRMASMGAKTTERALQRQAEQLQQQFEEAVANRDTAGAARAVKDLQELQSEAANSAPARNVEQDFAARNPWYGADEEATAYAVSVSQREAAKGKSHAEQLDAVEKAIAKRFPELTGAPAAPKPPAAVNAPGRAPVTKKAKGYADLPADARKAIDNFAELFQRKHGQDPEKTRAELARDYWSEQAS